MIGCFYEFHFINKVQADEKLQNNSYKGHP